MCELGLPTALPPPPRLPISRQRADCNMSQITRGWDHSLELRRRGYHPAKFEMLKGVVQWARGVRGSPEPCQAQRGAGCLLVSLEKPFELLPIADRSLLAAGGLMLWVLA